MRMRRAKSLVESSSHSATLKLLEAKLGGGSKQVSPEVTRPLPPVPGSTSVSKTSESISVQTTDTLKRTEDNIYTSAIIRGEFGHVLIVLVSERVREKRVRD